MDWYTSPVLITLATVGSALFLFLVMIVTPAFIIRAILGGKAKMPLRKPLRAAIVCALAGGAAMILTILQWGHRRSYWPGWGVMAYAVGVIVAIPLLAAIFGLRLKPTYRLTAVCLICQILPLILMASSLIPMFSTTEGLTYFYCACLAVLAFTWIRRSDGPGKTV
jgi:hypothetical protein